MRNNTVVESRAYRKVTITESNPTYGDIFDLKEFIDMVSMGALIPDDGDGFFMIGDDVTNISVWTEAKEIPPETRNKIDKVLWLNK